MEEMPSISHVRVCHIVKQPSEEFEFNLRQDATRNGQVISEVVAEGPGDRAGLKKGDRIITVNGVNVDGKSHREVVNLIRESMPTNEIKFEVVDEDHDPNKPVADDKSKTNGDVAPIAIDLRPRICKIVKKRGTLGFHLEAQGSEGKPVCGSVYAEFHEQLEVEQNFPIDGDDLTIGHFIKEVTDGGPAADSGLRKGDRIIEVGSTNVEKMNHNKVVAQIKKGGNKITLLVVDEATYKHFTARKMKIKAKRAYSSSDVISDRSSTSVSGSVKSNQSSRKSQIKSTSSESVLQKSSEDDKVRLIHVVKEQGKGYGFFLRVKKGEKGDYLGEVEIGKPAERCGLMDEDRVVAVNGKLVLFRDHEDVVGLIKSIPNHVVLVVAGPKAIEHSKNHGLVATFNGATEHLLEKPKTLKLHRGDDGYGYYLKMDQGSSRHIISNVETDSVAARKGLKDGDILACVEGSCVMHIPHEECVQMIKNAGDSVEMTVGTEETMAVLYDLGIKVTPEILDNWPMEEHFLLPDIAEHDHFFKGAVAAAVVKEVVKEAANEINERKTRVCTLRKIEGGFGFFLRDDFAHLLSNVEKRGAADVAGIQEDDQILEVNGVNVEKMAHEEVVNMIRTSGEEVVFRVTGFEGTTVSTTGAGSSKPIEEAKTESVLDDSNRPLPRFCELTKENNTFGFHLNMEGGDRPGQYIHQIAKGGAGEKAGLLEGDRVIEANGEKVDSITHDDVVAIIKASGDKVNFLVVDKEADLYYKEKSVDITRNLLVSIAIVEAEENFDSHSNASSVIEAEATVHASSDDQEPSSPVMEFPPPPPEEEDVTDLIEDAINEFHQEEIRDEFVEEVREEVEGIREDVEEIREEVEEIREERDEVASEIKEDLEEELTEIAEEIREQTNDEAREEIRETIEEIKDAAVGIAVVAAVEEVREEMQEEAQEEAREELVEDIKEEIIEEIKEEFVEEIKEDVEERMKEEMRQRIELEMRQKMEEEMQRKAEEALKRKREEEEEEMKKRIEQEMREKIAEELRQKVAEEAASFPDPPKFIPPVVAASAADKEVKLKQSVKKTPSTFTINQASKNENLTEAVQKLRKVRKAEEVVSNMKEEKREEKEKPFVPKFMSARAMFEGGNVQQQSYVKPSRQNSGGVSVKPAAIPNGNTKSQPTRQPSSSGKPLPFKIIETSEAFR